MNEPTDDAARIEAARLEILKNDKPAATPPAPEVPGPTPAPTEQQEGEPLPPLAAAVATERELARLVLSGDLVAAEGKAPVDTESLRKLVFRDELASVIGSESWDAWGFPPGSKEAALDLLVPYLSLDADGKPTLASKAGPVPLTRRNLEEALGPLAGRILPPQGFPGTGVHGSVREVRGSNSSEAWRSIQSVFEKDMELIRAEKISKE